MSLVQHWKCQDNAASTTVVAAVGTNASLVGGDNTSAITVGSGPGTALSSALDLDGTNDYFDVSGASISFASGTTFTFAAWFKFDSLALTRAFIGIDGANTSRILIANATNQVQISGTSGTSNFTIPALSTGTWYHLLVSRTAGNTVRVFWDGVESSTGGLSIAQTFAPVRIGRANTLRHNGPICDVRVYNSDESANVAAIMAEKDTGGGGGSGSPFMSSWW